MHEQDVTRQVLDGHITQRRLGFWIYILVGPDLIDRNEDTTRNNGDAEEHPSEHSEETEECYSVEA